MDRYTQLVLTIIAVALVWIAVKDVEIVDEAMASTGVVEVKVVEMRLPQYQPIPVKVQGNLICNYGE